MEIILTGHQQEQVQYVQEEQGGYGGHGDFGGHGDGGGYGGEEKIIQLVQEEGGHGGHGGHGGYSAPQQAPLKIVKVNTHISLSKIPTFSVQFINFCTIYEFKTVFQLINPTLLLQIVQEEGHGGHGGYSAPAPAPVKIVKVCTNRISTQPQFEYSVLS